MRDIIVMAIKSASLVFDRCDVHTSLKSATRDTIKAGWSASYSLPHINICHKHSKRPTETFPVPYEEEEGAHWI